MSNLSDTQDAIRLLALRFLVEGAERALTRGLRTGEESVQAEGGRPSGRPPAPVPCLEDLFGQYFVPEIHGELVALLAKDYRRSATPQETRRTAELLEFMDREKEARPWWEKAARRGDRDAQDYVEILNAEEIEVEWVKVSSPHSELGDMFTPVIFPLSSHASEFKRLLSGASSCSIWHIGSLPPQLPGLEHQLVRDIEEFLAGLGPITDGRRR
ncbi:MAG TPA: hypothetical protein VIU15_27390 [Streptomyces sp.]